MSRTRFPEKNFPWSSELAYAIGLLTTDGNMSGDGRHITMRSSDLQLLNVFRQCLQINNGIKQSYNDGWATKPCYRIQFGNVQFYRWLKTIGLSPQKTYTIGKLQIPDECFRDFLRGHLDGDGTITTYQDRYNTYKNSKYIYTRLWVRFLSASKVHMLWLQQSITRLFSVSGHLNEIKPQRRDQTTSLWQLKFGKKESIKLLRRIYYQGSPPSLWRKRLLAQKALMTIPYETRRPYIRVGVSAPLDERSS